MGHEEMKLIVLPALPSHHIGGATREVLQLLAVLSFRAGLVMHRLLSTFIMVEDHDLSHLAIH